MTDLTDFGESLYNHTYVDVSVEEITNRYNELLSKDPTLGPILDTIIELGKYYASDRVQLPLSHARYLISLPDKTKAQQQTDETDYFDKVLELVPQIDFDLIDSRTQLCVDTYKCINGRHAIPATHFSAQNPSFYSPSAALYDLSHTLQLASIPSLGRQIAPELAEKCCFKSTHTFSISNESFKNQQDLVGGSEIRLVSHYLNFVFGSERNLPDSLLAADDRTQRKRKILAILVAPWVHLHHFKYERLQGFNGVGRVRGKRINHAIKSTETLYCLVYLTLCKMPKRKGTKAKVAEEDLLS